MVQKDLEDCVSEFFLKPVSSRWLYLESVCRRVIEQYDGLKTYFLTNLRRTGIIPSSESRYTRISSVLKMIQLLSTYTLLLMLVHVWHHSCCTEWTLLWVQKLKWLQGVDAPAHVSLRPNWLWLGPDYFITGVSLYSLWIHTHCSIYIELMKYWELLCYDKQHFRNFT